MSILENPELTENFVLLIFQGVSTFSIKTFQPINTFDVNQNNFLSTHCVFDKSFKYCSKIEDLIVVLLTLAAKSELDIGSSCAHLQSQNGNGVPFSYFLTSSFIYLLTSNCVCQPCIFFALERFLLISSSGYLCFCHRVCSRKQKQRKVLISKFFEVLRLHLVLSTFL